MRRPVGPTRVAWTVHIVRAGESLWSIAAAHGASLAAVLRWNPRAVARRLVSGERILVPGGSPMARVRPAAPRRSAASPSLGARSGRSPALPSPTPAPTSGAYRWPLPIDGLLTTRFSGAHLGIDIAAPSGTPVLAIAAGTVVWAGWKDNGGGNVVVIEHRDGAISTYNHNRAVAVRVGQRVARGQTIAWVGATGWATGPHLDFRIEIDGRFIDPLTVY